MSFWSDPIGSIEGTFSDPSKRKGLGELALGALAVGIAQPELLGLGGAGGAGAGVTELSTLGDTGISAAGTTAGWGGTGAATPLGADMAEGYGATAAPAAAPTAAGNSAQIANYNSAVANGITPEYVPPGATSAASGVASGAAAPGQMAIADNAAYANATAANAAKTAPSFLDTVKSTWAGLPTWQKATVGGIAGLAALMKMGAFKPNYMPTYQPPTADSYGLGRTMAAGYRPYIPAAEGGIMKLAMGGVAGEPYPQSQLSNNIYHAPTQMPTSANQMVGYQPSNMPMAQPIANAMASGGISAAGESSGPLQTYQAPSSSGTTLQSLASQYGVQLPSSLSGTTMAAEGGIMGLASGGDPLQQIYSAQEASAIDPKTGIPYGQEKLGGSGGFFGGLGQSVDNIGHGISDGIGSIGRSLGFAHGGNTGTYNLGGYSDGGRLLKGPGDGMSDHIPASIADKQPARLADGEFVVPADVVSHLGNGSTDAGARHLYSMMDKVRKARTGHTKQGKQIEPEKYLPA